jgi:peptidoglycan/xylan/chitin deacetylase (PgdA/CDA1 family)
MRHWDAGPVFSIIVVRTVQASLLAMALHWLLHWPLAGRWPLGLFFTPALCLYFLFVFVAPWSWGLPIVTRLKTREHVVALTFDDGPDPETTPQILRVLRERGVKATFFVLGEQVERHPDLLRQIVREGHTIGVHGWNHRALTLEPASAVWREIERAREAVRAASPGSEPPRLFRPPYGFKTLTMSRLASRCGCRLILWSLNPRDYRHRDAKQVAAGFVRGLHPGAVALLHDDARNITTARALPVLLRGLSERGYRCVPLAEDHLPSRRQRRPAMGRR